MLLQKLTFSVYLFIQESHSRITRFILICNYVTRIIEPLASRCAKFRFQPLPPESMKLRLCNIAESEKCNVSKEMIDEILKQAQGDMRRAVTTLQSVHALGDADFNTEDIAEMAGVPPASVVEGLWTALQTSEFGKMETAVEDVCANGYSAQDMLLALSKKVIESVQLNELSKADLSIRIAEAEKNLVDGADEYLQLMTVCSMALTCFEKSKVSK